MGGSPLFKSYYYNYQSFKAILKLSTIKNVDLYFHKMIVVKTISIIMNY